MGEVEPIVIRAQAWTRQEPGTAEPTEQAAAVVTPSDVDVVDGNRRFDPTYGYSVPQLLQIAPPKPPTDFESFWRGLYTRAMAVAPEVTREGPPQRVGNHDVHIVHYNGVNGERLGGYLALPVGRVPDNAVLYAHGYGGCGDPSEEQLAENSPTTAMLFTCVRGFGLSADPKIPSDSEQHVVHGIEKRETYELGESVSDVWSSATALLDMVPTARDRLYLDGTSFGGGIGAMALPWDRRFARAYLEVPSFGSQALRMTLPTTGSGRAVQRFAASSVQRLTKTLSTLAYFDAATAARFVRVPTMVAAARADATVAPPGQFAVFNGLDCDRELFVLSAGHAEIPASEERKLADLRREWFGMSTK